WHVEELRKRRDDQLGARETEIAQLRRELRGGIRVVRIDAQLDEERFDETRVAALVHSRERPAEDSWRIGAHAVLGRCREADEFGQEAALADARLPRDQHDLGAPDARGLE